MDPVYQALVARLTQSFVIHADESPVQLLQPRRTAYAWVYLGDAAHPYTLFDFTHGRGNEYPAAFLGGYAGFVQTDGYTGYNPVHGSGVRHLGCWAHVRRKFVEARDSAPGPASDALAFIRTLYAVESEIAAERLTSDSVVSLRRTRAGPILRRFGEWLETHNRTALPKSPLGQAIAYARNQWPTLGRYLDDARFAIGRVEEWRGTIVLLDPDMAGLNTDTMSQLHPTPVSTPRSSNRTCRFPASGSHPDRQAFAFGVAARWSGTGKSPSSSYR